MLGTKKIIDSQTSPAVTGPYAVVNQTASQYVEEQAKRPYNELLRGYRGILRNTGPRPRH